MMKYHRGVRRQKGQGFGYLIGWLAKELATTVHKSGEQDAQKLKAAQKAAQTATQKLKAVQMASQKNVQKGKGKKRKRGRKRYKKRV